ncbi:MAG: glycosyltransferase [Actinomycetota bacterium]
MTQHDIPDQVAELLRLREEARAAKDFARADELRDEILAAGFMLRDTPAGAIVEPRPAFEALDPASITSTLSEPASLDFSFHVLYEGFPEDVIRFVAALRAHNDVSSTEVVCVDDHSSDGARLEAIADDLLRIVHLDREVGWAAARNAGLKGARGAICVLVDLSVEPTGDILSPLRAALADETVGIAGPFGLTSETMREWDPSDGPEVDALEGYLIAIRREVLAEGMLHEKFKWYRNADIDFSFQVRSLGLRAVVVPLPLSRHAHRGWESLDEAERAKRSKRNHYLFFDRWKDRPDLLLANKGDSGA